jgi:ankyrin repeat domain-containing protein 50
MDELCSLRTDAAVRQALKQLPTSLEDSYGRILQTIAPSDEAFATRALLWLSHATRLLSLTELAAATVLSDNFTSLEPGAQFHDPTDILEICRSLVAYDDQSQVVRIAHHSVREFLVNRINPLSLFYMPAPTSHASMARTCFSYMLLPEFAAGPRFKTDFVQILEKYPLLRYAARKWPLHVKMSGSEKELLPEIRRLMTPHSNPHFLFWLQILLSDSFHGYVLPGKKLENARPLYYAASYGLTETVRSLVADGASLNDRAGMYGGTALHAAVWRKHPETLEVLLELGADPTIKDGNGASPAQLSLWNGAKRVPLGLLGKAKLQDNKDIMLLPSVLKMRQMEISALSDSPKPDEKTQWQDVRAQIMALAEQTREDVVRLKAFKDSRTKNKNEMTAVLAELENLAEDKVNG